MNLSILSFVVGIIPLLVIASNEHSVWSTLAPDNELFCSHVVYRNAPSYTHWFDNFCNRVTENLYILQNYRITNVFVFKPPLTHCYPHAIDVYVDTYVSDHALEAKLRTFAAAVKDVSAEDVTIHLNVAEFGSPFTQRSEIYGRFILRNQLIVRQQHEQFESGVLPDEVRNVIVDITRQYGIHLRRGWLENGRILLTLHSVQDNHVGDVVMEQFRSHVEQRLDRHVIFV